MDLVSSLTALILLLIVMLMTRSMIKERQGITFSQVDSKSHFVLHRQRFAAIVPAYHAASLFLH